MNKAKNEKIKKKIELFYSRISRFDSIGGWPGNKEHSISKNQFSGRNSIGKDWNGLPYGTDVVDGPERSPLDISNCVGNQINWHRGKWTGNSYRFVEWHVADKRNRESPKRDKRDYVGQGRERERERARERERKRAVVSCQYWIAMTLWFAFSKFTRCSASLQSTWSTAVARDGVNILVNKYSSMCNALHGHAVGWDDDCA